MRQLAILSSIAVLLVAGCGGTTASAPADAGAADAAVPGPFVVISDGVKQLDARTNAVVMADGRIIRFDRLREIAPRTIAAPPAIEMREQTVLTTSGEIYRIWPLFTGTGKELANATRIDQPGPFVLFRNGWVRNANGAVLAFEFDSAATQAIAEAAGADQCASGRSSSVCLFAGVAKDMVREGAVIDVEGKVVDVAEAPVPLYPGVAGSGVVLLRDDGAVFISEGVPSDKPALPPVRIEHGLPPIARLHRGFFEDREGKIWFFGVTKPESWPLGLISPDVPRFPCTIYYGSQKGDSPPDHTQCVRPVEIPALAHTAPTLAFADMAIVTVTPDGKLLCWPNIGRTCQKVE